jgi:hypothetical protein
MLGSRTLELRAVADAEDVHAFVEVGAVADRLVLSVERQVVVRGDSIGLVGVTR